MPYVRTVKTGPGATAVQVVWSSRRGSGSIQHIGSAHDEAELEVLKAAARQRMAVGQLELGLGMARGRPGRYRSRLRGWASCWTPSSMATACWGSGGRPTATRFPAAGTARFIEPTSKLDSLRVLEEAGAASAAYATVKRRLPAYPEESWRHRLSATCAAHAGLGPASLVLYDVSTLYFETDAGDGFREPGFSKERRLEPQITIGLLTGQDGFPLMVSASQHQLEQFAEIIRRGQATVVRAGRKTRTSNPASGTIPASSSRPQCALARLATRSPAA